jgi:SagB-type dehydrogenase family enzyme
MVLPGDKREDLFRSALYQEAIKEAPVTIVICAVYERTTRKYGERGIRYVHMEAGHAGQNIYLQAEALDLGTVAIGAFYDEAVARVLDLPKDIVPLYLFPVGKR